MFEKLANTVARRPQPKQEMLKFGLWPDGLVTEYEPEQMKPSQLFESLNMVVVGGGVQRTRDGSSLVSDGCTGEVVTVEDIKVGDTWYTIISDTDNKLYWNNSGTATAIATLEGEAQFCGFMGLLIIFDSSFIKSWDGTTLSILYDNGTGAVTPYQVNNRTATATTDKPLGNGTMTSVELAFTSQTWDTGYTIPMTHIFAQLYKVGTPTGTILAKVKTAGDVVMSSTEISTTVASLTTETAGEEYEAIILPGDIITPLSPNTSYKVVLEYSGGDGAKYVNVKAVDVSTPMLSLKPGTGPKSVFGLVHEDRLHTIEGVDGTNPSYDNYCAAGNQLDWSTADGGGFAPVIDNSATNYPIGSIASWNKDLWFFGIKRQPFLGKLFGTSPADWAINSTMEKVSGHYKSTVVSPDNIVFLHPAGVDMISSITNSLGQTDLSAESQTDNVRKTIQTYFSTAAVAGYDPEWGLYVLKMAGTDDIYIVNTRAKSVKYSGRKGVAFSPVTRWQYAFAGSPTAFGHGNGFMLIGTDDGKVYKMDKSEVQDGGVDATYKLITASQPTVFGEAQAWKIGYKIFGERGGNCNIKFYRDYSRTSFDSLPFALPIDSNLLTVDADMLTATADFYANPEQYFDREDINFNYRNLMIGLEDIVLFGRPLYFGEINLLSKRIGGF